MQQILAAVGSRPRSIGRVRRSSDEIYRQYRLVAGEQGHSFAAVAYAGKVAAFQTAGDSLDAALDALRAAIDADLAERTARRGDGELTSPDLERALDLLGIRKTPVQQHILERILASNQHPTTGQDLRLRSDFFEDALIRGLARLARTIADALQIDLSKGPASSAAAINLIVEAMGQEFNPASDWHFRPEFMIAVRRHMTK